ncbi:MAG: ThiF family adenylyltransferase [Deltaproteobacteria bacterium]|nr:ThiF family adenylyltransferase [Deltaproteobacteria bacterium]
MTARPEDRLAQAGADALRIAETGVLVVLDDSPRGLPWDHPAWALCRGLQALGFGQVQLAASGPSVGDLSTLMPAAEFESMPTLYLGDLGRADDGTFGVVLHLGSSPQVRRRCAHFANDTSAFASLDWTSTGVSMLALAVDEAAAVRTAAEPIAPVARIAAGLLLQEALIGAGRLVDAAPAAAEVRFDVAGEDRTPAPGTDASDWKDAFVEDAIIDVIGAGGVGTHLLESLAPLLGDRCELRIFDFDRVGPENLAIQPSFSADDIGRPKAVVMAEKLAVLTDAGVDLRPMPVRYEDRLVRLGRPSLRIACPDTFAARRYLNDCSLADGVPLAEAGSSPLAAQHRVYLPGETACLAHRIPRLAELADEESDRATCSLAQALTLPGTNMICGGILAAEALRALDPDRFGPPSRGTIAYDARFPERFGVTDARPACSHD